VLLLLVVIMKSGGKKRGGSAPAPVAAGYGMAPGHAGPAAPNPRSCTARPVRRQALAWRHRHRKPHPEPYGGQRHERDAAGPGRDLHRARGQELRAGRDARPVRHRAQRGGVSGVHATFEARGAASSGCATRTATTHAGERQPRLPRRWSPVPKGSICASPVEFSARIG